MFQKFVACGLPIIDLCFVFLCLPAECMCTQVFVFMRSVKNGKLQMYKFHFVLNTDEYNFMWEFNELNCIVL